MSLTVMVAKPPVLPGAGSRRQGQHSGRARLAFGRLIRVSDPEDLDCSYDVTVTDAEFKVFVASVLAEVIRPPFSAAELISERPQLVYLARAEALLSALCKAQHRWRMLAPDLGLPPERRRVRAETRDGEELAIWLVDFGRLEMRVMITRTVKGYVYANSSCYRAELDPLDTSAGELTPVR